MRKGLVFSILFTLGSLGLLAQEYFLPYNIKKAYQAETRSLSGIPGKNYFQNSADYKIKVSFDPVKGMLVGSEKISYHNNSHDTLFYIVIRLYHDILKKGNLRDDNIDPEYINDGVKLKSLVIENNQYIGNDRYFLNRNGTNLAVSLPYRLYPGDSTSLQIDWSALLPKGKIHRFGNYGPSDWFIGYWYPQISVYDDVDGWDDFNYTGLYEFYNDFNNFDVEINVPARNLVWATGDWENPDEILSPFILERYKLSKSSDKTIPIVTSDDWSTQSVFRKNKKLKYIFSARNICDFAFAVSDSYIWDAASVVNDSLHNRVTVNAVYPSDNDLFTKVAQAGVKSIGHFSTQSLGISYPFNHVTVFDGEGGMEYPMMVNMHSEDAREVQFVIMHEIFHGYFPFFTGNNERKYAWMDEGLTSYLPMITEKYLGGSYFQLPQVCRNYSDFAGDELDVPLMTPSVLTRDASYYQQAYFRSTVAYSMLEKYLGQDTFRAFIRYFVSTWKGKHPTGYDFIFALQSYTGKDLYWLVNPWFFERGWPDLAIEKAAISDNGLEISIRNIGGFPVPVELKIILPDGQNISKSVKADCWKDKSSLLKVIFDNVTDFQSIELGNTEIPDKNFQDNFLWK